MAAIPKREKNGIFVQHDDEDYRAQLALNRSPQSPQSLAVLPAPLRAWMRQVAK